MRFNAPSPASPASTPTSPILSAGPTRWPDRDNSREQTMTPDVRLELEGLVEELQALSRRLRRYHQPLATQLLEMALLEIKSRMYGIDDNEFQALVDTLSGQASSHSQV